METNQGDRLHLICECRAPIAVVPGDLALGLCYLTAMLGGTLILKGTPNLWPPLTGLRSFGRRLCWFLQEDIADTHSRRPGRLCYLRLQANVDSFDCHSPTHGIAEVLRYSWRLIFLEWPARLLDSLKAFGKYAFVTVLLGPLAGAGVAVES